MPLDKDDLRNRWLDEIKYGNNLQQPLLTEVEVEALCERVFHTLGFVRPATVFVEPQVVRQLPDANKDRPDIKLIFKSCIIPIDVKKHDGLEGPKYSKALVDKARYARKSRFGMLSNGETWIIFEIKPLDIPLIDFDHIRVLLQFEASTPGTQTLLEKIAKSPEGQKKAKSAELERALQMVKHQEALTKAVMRRLTPSTMLLFFRFLSFAHSEMTWEEFDRRMNLSLEQRRKFFQGQCKASAADLAVADAIYSSARFATELMQYIVPNKLAQLTRANAVNLAALEDDE